MEKKSSKIQYTRKTNARVKNMRIAVSLDGSVVVTAPGHCTDWMINAFVLKNSAWIREKLKHFAEFEGKSIIKINRRDYLKYKEKTRKLVKDRIAYFNKYYNFKFNRISIKNQKTLWGSCSSAGNLNFNYALVKLSPELADYVIVHEMCHLWHFDHSREFWKLVARTVPEYKKIRKKIKEMHFC